MKEKSFVRGRNMAGIQVKKCASVHCRAILQCALEEQHRRKIQSAWCTFPRLQLH